MPVAFPHFTIGAAASWSTVDGAHWAAGFMPGLCWKMFAHTGDTAWRTRAEAWQAALTGVSDPALLPDTHDLGFMFGESFVEGYRLAGDESFRTVALNASYKLDGRWNAGCATTYAPSGGYRSFNSGVNGITLPNTIIDSAMAMKLMFWAGKNGETDPDDLYDRAIKHMLTLRTNHVRADGSTYQVTTYNATTGVVVGHPVVQGTGSESTWSRGQAWAMHGFTDAYAQIKGDPARAADAANLLDTAKKTAAYWVDHQPADKIALWDFNAPAGDTQKDSSAAAIAASALIELGRHDSTRDWKAEGKAILDVLFSDAYLAAVPATGATAILRHGTSSKPANVGVDAGLIYGDLYGVEALERFAAAPVGPVQQRPTDINEDFATVGAQFPDREGLATLRAGQLALGLSATVAYSAARTNSTLFPVGQGVVMRVATDGAVATGWPAWVSGSGEVWTEQRLSYANGVRAILRRKTTFDAATTGAGFPANSHITADKVEARIVQTVGTSEIDPAPFVDNWSALPANTAYLKLGVSTTTKVLMAGSAAGTLFPLIRERTFDATVDLTGPATWEIAVRRVSGDVVTTEALIDSAFGVANPNADASTAVGAAKDNSAAFTGTQARIFPIPTALKTLPVTLLFYGKLGTDTTHVHSLLGLSEADAAAGRTLRWDPQAASQGFNFRESMNTADATVSVSGGRVNARHLVAASIAADGKVSFHWWDEDGTDPKWHHALDVGTAPNGGPSTNAQARIVIANPFAGSIDPKSFSGLGNLWVAWNRIVTSTELEGLVGANGIITRGAVMALAPSWGTDWQGTDATYVMQDFSGGANHQSAALGTLTVDTTVGDVNYDHTATGTATPPPGETTLADPTAATGSAAQITAGSSPQSGEVTVSWTAPTGVPGGLHATPYLVQTSFDGVTWADSGTYQAGTSKTVTGIPLETPFYVTYRYRNAAGIVSNRALPAVVVAIPADQATLTPVSQPIRTRQPIRFNGGTMEIRLVRPATSESVDGYHVRMTPKTAAGVATGPEFLAFDGPGTVEGSEVVLLVTGLDDTVPRYGTRVFPWRTEV